MLISSLIWTIVVQYRVNAVKTVIWSTKVYQLCWKVASNWEYVKRDHVTPILLDLKWINFNSILRLNEASFVYKILYVSADSNVKNINFDLRNKVSQRITRNGSDVHIVYRRTLQLWDKKLSQYRACGIRSQWISEIQIPSFRSNVTCTNISLNINNQYWNNPKLF